MLLDRVADVYLAQRCGAEGGSSSRSIALRLQRAALAIAGGEPYQEGVPRPGRRRVEPHRASTRTRREAAPSDEPPGNRHPPDRLTGRYGV